MDIRIYIYVCICVYAYIYIHTLYIWRRKQLALVKKTTLPEVPGTSQRLNSNHRLGMGRCRGDAAKRKSNAVFS